MASQKTKGPSLSDGVLRHLGISSTKFQGGNNKNKGRTRKQPIQEGGRRQRSDGAVPPNKRIEEQSISASGKKQFTNSLQSADRLYANPDLEEEADDSDFGGFDSSEGEGDGGGDESGFNALASAAISKQVRERLQKDDDEIAELERKLGIRGRKNLPKSFEEDGLGDLVGSFDSGDNFDKDLSVRQKRKAEAEEWLRQKRKKAVTAPDRSRSKKDGDENEGWDKEESGSEVSSNLASSLDDDDHPTPRRQRENPYIAPVPAAPVGKYIPPALRGKESSNNNDSEVISQVRRQAHHLIARLSDANMLTILGEVEKLYLDCPRQYVTDAVVDKLLEQIAIEGVLSNSVVMLIAGFATAVYQVRGIDFGAHFVQQCATLFRQSYDALLKQEALGKDRTQNYSSIPTSKVALNLLGLVAELYNFRMLGPNLVYDYIRMMLGNFTEINTELLLRLFEASGHRLRQDDPRALKDIVSLIQPAVLHAGGEHKLSARTRHMIERIHELKKTDKKKARNSGGSGFEYAERMRKTLISMANTRKLEATGSIRVGLSDIEQIDKRGKWWLVGASWTGHETSLGNGDSKGQSGHSITQRDEGGDAKQKNKDDVLGSWGDAIPDVDELEQLAREQGMNTNSRRSIFIALLSAADSKDAHARLQRLNLNKYDKREIANVLIRCVGSEQHYNRYYALVARQVCSTDHRMSRVLQISLWKLFRRLGEPMFGELADEYNADEEDEAVDLRRTVNTAKMYGYLVARRCLGLDILKCLQLVHLQAKTQMFVHVLLITLFEEARGSAKVGNSSSSISRCFAAINGNEGLRQGLGYFLEHVVRKSELVPPEQALIVDKACSKAQQALRV